MFCFIWICSGECLLFIASFADIMRVGKRFFLHVMPIYCMVGCRHRFTFLTGWWDYCSLANLRGSIEEEEEEKNTHRYFNGKNEKENHWIWLMENFLNSFFFFIFKGGLCSFFFCSFCDRGWIHCIKRPSILWLCSAAPMLRSVKVIRYARSVGCKVTTRPIKMYSKRSIWWSLARDSYYMV